MSNFLAEAQVLITPNTAGFRTELIAQLAAATKGVTVPVPVTVAPVTTGTVGVTAAVAAATREVAASSQAAGAALEQAAFANRDLQRAQRLTALSAEQLVLAQQEVANATSVAAARQIQASRAVVAVETAQKALRAALASTNLQAEIAAASQLQLAEAELAGAVAASQAARAEAAHSASLSQVQRSLLATTAAQFGLRGAVLASTGPFLAAAVAATAFFKTIQAAAQVEQQLNTFQAVAGATADQMERVAQAARELGADVSLPAVSAADAAQAMTELAKAGLDVENSIDAARGTLLLAAAAQIDNAQATELTANALNAFRLEGEEATKVADLLAGASIEAQGSIEDMGLALQQSAAVAKLVGLSLQDTVTFITLLAQNGLRGSDAGTSLRVALLRLINPTKQARQVIEELGIAIRDTQGNLRTDVFEQFAQATAGFSKAQRDAALATVFGADAIRSAALLAAEGASGFADAQNEIAQMGIAADVAGARTKGFSGQLEAMGSNIQTIAGTIGGQLLPPLTQLLQILNLGASGVIRFADALTDLEIAGVDVSRSLREVVLQINPITQTARRAELAFNALRGVFGGTEEDEEDLNQTTKILGAGFTNLADAATRASSQIKQSFSDALQDVDTSFQQLTAAIGRTQQDVLSAQIEGNTRSQRAALARQAEQLRDAIEEQQKIISAGGLPGRPGVGVATARERQTQFQQQLVGVLAEIEGIDEAAVAEAKAAAREAERRAKEIQDARTKASQAIVDALGPDQTRAQNQVARAALSETLADDIRANENFRDVLRAQLDLVRRTVQDAKVRAQEIARLTQQLFQVGLTLKRLRDQRAEQAKQDAIDAKQRRDDILQARIELAEATGNRQAEINARKARIKALQDEIRAAKGDTLRILQLRTEIARERAALKELQDEVEERGKAFQELSFSFLQAQQGFAANLFGNLIPSGATQGLVGGGGGAAAFAPSIATQISQLPRPQAGIGLEAGLAQARDTGGVTQGQFGVLIDLTRQIVRILGGVRDDNKAPEGRYNLAVQHAMMDGPAAHGGV